MVAFVPVPAPARRTRVVAARSVRRPWTAFGGALLAVSLPWSTSGAASEPLMGPWLQQPTSDSVVVMWETDEPTRGVVRYGSAAGARREVRSDAQARLHEVRLSGLAPGAACAYEVESTTSDGRRLVSAPATFVPAPLPGAPVCFAVVGDAQDQPAVWSRVAARVHAERPAFLLHCGDIVGDGHDPRAWREEFFAPARALLAHVPFLAVLGNHEGDSPLYYRYVSNPAPEHRCALRYGDVEVFLVDSERPLDAGSEQHGRLACVLRAPTAVWKVGRVHRPRAPCLPWPTCRCARATGTRTRVARCPARP